MPLALCGASVFSCRILTAASFYNLSDEPPDNFPTDPLTTPRLAGLTIWRERIQPPDWRGTAIEELICLFRLSDMKPSG